MKISTFKTFLLLSVVASTSLAYAQTASILPPAKTQFLGNDGKPLTSGTVDFYIPSTTTRKTTWQNSGETVANTNPVVLDAGGRAIIYGEGVYRQVVKDRFGNPIWDQLTSSTGSGSSSPTATGDGDLVGTIKPWAGMTAPNQYAFTYGQEVNRTTYATLYTAITSSQPVFCTSASPILTGLSDTTNFWIGMSLEATCVAAGFSTVVSKTATTVTMAANANVTTNITAVFYPWGRGNGTTTFNLPDFRGVPIAGNNNMGGTASSNLTTTYFGSTNPNSVGALGGSQSATLVAGNLPSHTHTSSTLTDPGHTHATTNINGAAALDAGGGAQAFAGGASRSIALTTGFSINNASTGITISASTGANASGLSTAFSLVQPTRTSNYIIKITPDTNSASASGVTSIQGMTGDIACAGNITCTGNVITVPASVINTALDYNWTGANTFTNAKLPGGLGTASGARTPQYTTFTNCTRPEEYGALRDGTTDDTGPIIRAANAAFSAGIGLCLTAGNSYATTAIQFGVGVSNNNGTFTGTGTSVGSIGPASTTMTIANASSIDIAPGMSVTGAGVTAGTNVTTYTGGTGQLGTYLVNNSQTVGAGTTLTFTAPSFTASISGTVMTVTAVANGFLRREQNITGIGVLEGTTISSLGTGTGGTGTYNLNYSQTVASSTMRANNVSVANIPIFIKGDSGQKSVFKAITPLGGPIEKKYITIYNPTNSFSPDPPFGAVYEDFKVQGQTQYSLPFVVQGSLYSRIGNITVTGGLSCNVSFIANVLTGLIYNTFYNIYSRGEGVSSGNGICITGKDQTLSYNFQLNDMSNIQAQGFPGDGWIIDWAKFSCTGCGSESNTGRSYRLDFTQRILWIDSYSEANAGGGMVGTANTKGLIITGQYEDAFDAALLADPSNTFNYTQTGVNNRSAGYVKPSISTVAALPACGATYQGAVLTVSDANASAFGVAVTGGGANTVNVSCRGSGSWLNLSGPNLNASQINSGTVPAANGGAGGITGALRANGSGVVTQAACADLSNGTASCSTDTTNATNISSGTLATARGGVSQTAWTSYSPTITTAGGSATFTINTATYKQIGKTVHVTVDYNCTAVGTGTGATLIPLPITANGIRAAGVGQSYATNIGRIMTVYLSAATPTAMQVMDGGPATAISVNSFVVSLTYEVP